MYQNQPSFVEDMVKEFGLLFSWIRCSLSRTMCLGLYFFVFLYHFRVFSLYLGVALRLLVVWRAY